MRRAVLGCIMLLAALVVGQGCGPKTADDPASARLTAARTAWLAGDYPKAEAAYRRYLKEFSKAPERLEAWRRLADIARDVRGDPGEAAGVLESALLEFYKNPIVKNALAAEAAEAWLRANEPGRAVGHLRGLLAETHVPPKNRVRASLQLARALQRLHDPAGAATVLRQCRTSGIGPTMAAPCSVRLAGLLLEANLPEEARALWKAVYDDGAVDASVRATAGFALGEEAEARHDKRAAKAWYEAVRKIYPNPAVIEKKLDYLR